MPLTAGDTLSLIHISCNYAKCCKHLENCIDKGVFGENAYLDMRTGTPVSYTHLLKKECFL